MNSVQITRALGLCVAVPLVASALSFTPASAAPALVSLVATSQDGPAFDLDEHAAGDITVQVTDATGADVDVVDQHVKYSWTVTPFGATTGTVRVPATGTTTQTTDVNGEFTVPLPLGQGAGTYALTAELGPDAADAGAISSAVLLTVKAGNATVAFADKAPVQAQAGTDVPVSGTLRLEDGTGLPGRSVDLTLGAARGGTDRGADAGFVPTAPATALVDSLNVTTTDKGAFGAVLSDPAEDPQGTELGRTITAATAAATATLAVDLVSTTAPKGSTAVLTDLGAATPGQALSSTLTVTAPDDTFDVDPATPGVQGDADADRDPVIGQVYALTVDHGFFTTGQGPRPAVVGAPAGDLVTLGTKLTGITDANGQVKLQVGIARDHGFDDDGLVTATVTAAAGGPSATKTAAWDSRNPLNGKVGVTLSPGNEQENPVNPTLAGDRAFFEVFTYDQFGNPVDGKPIDLTYSGNLDDWDYSDDFAVSDLDLFGDIWVTSFEAGAITITGTWEEAPTYRYSDTAGTAVAGQADVTGSITTSTYEHVFGTSSFSIASSATDVVGVGAAVTQTVRVLDKLGNPVRGYDVRFFREGPDAVTSDAVATRRTNAQGEASYTFIGTRAGRAKITAEVSDGTSRRVLTTSAVFGATIKARLAKAGKGGPSGDRLRVSTRKQAAGARVQLYRVYNGKRILVGSKTLDKRGTVAFKIRDRNRKAFTTYVATVRSTSKSVAAQSNSTKIR